MDEFNFSSPDKRVLAQLTKKMVCMLLSHMVRKMIARSVCLYGQRVLSTQKHWPEDCAQDFCMGNSDYASPILEKPGFSSVRILYQKLESGLGS